MAYDKDKILQQLLDNIQADEDITTFEDAAITVAPTRQALYLWGFDKIDTIKEAIEKNKVKVKKNLRKQWRYTENATLQLALYKLLSTPDELRSLSMQAIDHSGEIKLPKLSVEVIKPDEGK